jgi:glutathione peroxidase
MLIPILALTIAAGPLDFKAQDIDGRAVELSQFRGKVVMIVNVASKCGLTPQYSQLESLYRKYKDAGFVILGFPANEFGGQEPGSNAEIKEFCTTSYNVSFPMFSKIVVKGEGIHPLYQFLTSPETSKCSGEIKWNFTKFLVDRSGELIARFEPRVTPDSPDVVKAIESALAR